MEKMKKADFVLIFKVHAIVAILAMIFIVSLLWNQNGVEYLMNAKRIFGVFVMGVIIMIPASYGIGLVILEFRSSNRSGKYLIILLLIGLILRALYQIKLHK